MGNMFKLAFEEIQEPEVELELKESNDLEILDLRHSIKDDLNGTSHALGVVNAMEDLCDIIRQIDEPRPTDYALIRVAANMAVAGTNLSPTAVIPATEDFTEIKASIGKIGEKIFSTMKALGNVLINIFKAIKKWIAAIFYKLRTISSKIKVLREKVRELKKTKSNVILPVTVKGNLGYLFGDKAEQVTDINEYSKEIGNVISFTNSVKDISLSYAQGTYGFAFDIVISLRSKEAKEQAFKKVYASLISLMETLSNSGHFHKGNNRNNAIKNSELHSSNVYLGLNIIELLYPNDSSYDLEDHNSLRNTLNNFKIEHSFNDEEFNSEMEIKDVNLNSLETLLKTSADLIQTTQVYYDKIDRLTDTRLEDADRLARQTAEELGGAIGGKVGSKDGDDNKEKLGETLGKLAGTIIYEGSKSVVGSITGVDTLITVSTDVLTSLVWAVDSLQDTIIYPVVALAEKSLQSFESYQAS